MTQTVTVVNTGRASRYLGRLRLDPGATDVNADDWRRESASEFCRALLKAGALRAQETPAPVQDLVPDAGPPVSLGELKPSAARNAIAACTDPEQLTRWLQTDGRENIRKALLKRRYELEPPAVVEGGLGDL